MPTILAQISMEADTQLPEDVTINTWHFVGSSAPADLPGLDDAIHAFYADIQSFLSASLTGNVTARYYDLADAEPRIPRFMSGWTITPNTESLPREVSLCLSFQSQTLSGDIAARRRNRVFLGPLAGLSTHTSLYDSDLRPSTAMIEAMLDAVDNLVNVQGTGDYSWITYSQVEAAGGGVTKFWIDNAFDTMRKRGRAATNRSVRVLP